MKRIKVETSNYSENGANPKSNTSRKPNRKTMKPIALFSIVTIIYLSALLGCAADNKGKKFLGKWECDRGYLTITKAGETAYTLLFEVKFKATKYDFLSPPPETYTAKLVNGNLETGTLNDLIVAYSNGKLIIGGREWEKME